MKLRTQFFAILLIAFGSLCILLVIGRQRLNDAVRNTSEIIDNQFNPLVLENAPRLQQTYEGLTSLLDAMSNAQSARMLQMRSIALDTPKELAPLIQQSEASLASMRETLDYAEKSFPEPIHESWSKHKVVLQRWHERETQIIELTKTLAADLELRARYREKSEQLFTPFRSSIDVLGEQVDEKLHSDLTRQEAEAIGTAISLVLNADRDAYQALLGEQEIVHGVAHDSQVFNQLKQEYQENLQQIRDRVESARELAGPELKPSFSFVLGQYENWREATQQAVSITSRIHQSLSERNRHVEASTSLFLESQQLLAVVQDRLREFANHQLASFEVARDQAMEKNEKLRQQAYSYTQIFNSLSILAFLSFIQLLFFQRRLVFNLIGLSRYLSKLDQTNLEEPFKILRQRILPTAELEELETSLNAMRTRLAEVIKNHEDALQRLARSEAHFSRLFYNDFSPMLLVEPSTGRIVDANQAAAQLYEKSGDQLSQSSIDQLGDEGFSLSIRSLKRNGRHVLTSVQRKGSGAAFTAEIFAGMIEHEETPHALLIVSDISQRMAFENELLKAKTAAEEANKTKDEFLSVMSHELRTPLNPIIGYAEILGQHSKESFIQECSKVTLNAARRMLELVESILLFTQLNHKDTDFPIESFTFDDLFDEVTATQTLRLSQSKITIVNGTESLQRIPENTQITAPLNVIKQVMMNLVNNAIKYANDSPIEIRVGIAYPQSGDMQTIRIEVSDQGPGIPDHYKEKIFDPFTQADSSTTRSHEGIGLGLAICSKLTRLLGGRIGLTDNQPHGACFWFTTPVVMLSPLPAGEPTVAESSDEQHSGLAVKILVVEDNEDNARYISRAISAMGALPQRVNDGRSAIELCRRETFDIVLLDISMRDMNGLETLDELRKIPLFKQKTSCIAVTAHASVEMEQRCLSRGFDAFLRKPVAVQDLKRAIAQYA
ncbi:ATP-binding protein [Pelagicoccus sp. SDUM812003]|uniref:ATP-binding protein n=1 Tax=Pelagicoccus sp. SDUM812003 TaxID=3041267 RepID=UPI00280F2BE2|nr:ATP-binding protein [Pelagicoccus sp. SDUM812003]MDQ8204184.1 ATP-binding protein [Pelagicoccus sp. SDUM812003]